MDERGDIAMLRHFLAALAYRTQKALRDAPPEFADFRVAKNVRTPHELIWHMTGVIGYAVSLFRGTKFQPDRLETFEAEIERFHVTLEELSEHLGTSGFPESITPDQLLQGPMADAMTHAGQIAMLRRLQGNPIAPENFLWADVDASNLSSDQAMPRAPKEGWDSDQPPPAPGRPLK